MDDETKPEQKSPSLEPPKDIEDLLKELPKIDAPKPPAAPLPIQSERSSANESRIRDLPAPTSKVGGQVGTKPPMLPPLTVGSMPKPTLNPSRPAQPPPNSPAAPPQDPNKFKSLVRTMEQDLEAAKKGMKPEPKPFEIKPPPGGPKIAPPPPPLKMPLILPPKLGPSEKTKSFEMPKERTPLPPTGAPAQKAKFSLSPKFLVIILVVLAVFAGAWYLMTREPEPVVVFTPTPTPTPVPKTLSELIPSTTEITISSTENFVVVFSNSIKTLAIAPETFVLLNIVDESNRRYELGEIISNLQLNMPIFGMGPQFALFAYGQTEVFDNKGSLMLQSQSPATVKIGIIIEVPPLDFPNYSWEITMTDDLKNFFSINPQKATSEVFLDNIYSGTDIRYRNFPYADNSIDYAIVSLPEFNADYFILTNSRESIYSTIDLLLSQ